MRRLYSCLFFVTLSFCEKLPQKIMICGVCKNVAYRLPYSIKIMEKIGDLFSDYRVVVYQDNSSDQTSEILKNWSKKNTKVQAISEYIEDSVLKKLYVNWDSAAKGYFKPECIARARNIVQNIAMSDQYQQFEYVIWMDMDFKYEPFYGGFKEIFTSNRPWDAVFANGVAGWKDIWDWYAFRNSQYPLGPELLGIYWWNFFKQLTLTTKDDWMPVYSAFGGCGIYKKSSIQGCQYSGLVTKELGDFYKKILQKEFSKNQFIQRYLQYVNNLKKTVKISCFPHANLPNIKDPEAGVIIEGVEDIVWRVDPHVCKYPSVCEHVPFHASMIAHGHDKLFICPRLLFYYDNDNV